MPKKAVTAFGTPAPVALADKPTLVRLPEVMHRVPLSRASIYRLMRNGKFPQARRLSGGKAIAWLSSEIDAYIANLATHADPAA